MGFKGTKEEWKKEGAKLIIGKLTYVPQCKIEDFNSIEEFNRVTEVDAIHNVNLMEKSPKMLEMLRYIYSNDLLKDNQEEVLKLIKEATEL